MKRYKGWRDERGETQVRVYEDGLPERSLDTRLDLRRHSPSGFEWGYLGSGPAQLALAILAEHFHGQPDADEKAQSLYQEFKAQAIARFPRVGFSFNDLDVEAKIIEIRMRREERRSASVTA